MKYVYDQTQGKLELTAVSGKVWSSQINRLWYCIIFLTQCNLGVIWHGILFFLSMLVTQTWGWVIVHVHTSFIHRIPIKSRFTSHNKNTKSDRWDHKQFLKIFDWQHKNVTSWVTNFKLDFSPSPSYNIGAEFPRQYYRFKIFFKKEGRGGQGPTPCTKLLLQICKGLWGPLKGRICLVFQVIFDIVSS